MLIRQMLWAELFFKSDPLKPYLNIWTIEQLTSLTTGEARKQM